MHPKQQLKRKLFSPLNILIFVTLLALLGFGTYYLLDVGKEVDVKSGISQSHDKIITNSDSSKKEGSNSGSSSSKSSNSNSKPNAKSLPASKSILSSNPGLIGKMGSGDEPPNDDEDNGDKRDKKLKKASSTSGGSTEEDSEDDEDSEEEDEKGNDGIVWVDTKLEGNTASPLVGSARP